MTSPTKNNPLECPINNDNAPGNIKPLPKKGAFPTASFIKHFDCETCLSYLRMHESGDYDLIDLRKFSESSHEFILSFYFCDRKRQLRDMVFNSFEDGKKYLLSYLERRDLI